MRNRLHPVQKTASLKKEDKEMLNIIGQAMMIATRMDAPRTADRLQETRPVAVSAAQGGSAMRAIFFKVARRRS